ncbi:MAG: hypothetical protein HRT89_01405 [Lentisphaeria bacterium]|nr:hypothetical protein [Lentisphaeria bacterium]
MLYAEISWPLHVPYERRQKASYQTLIYKPGILPSTEIGIAKDMVCKTLWAINDSGTKLQYYILSDGNTFINEEGSLDRTVDVGALTFSTGGSIFFIDNSGGSCTLYSIGGSSLDLDSSTPSVPTRIGSTGISSNSNDEITALQFVNGALYAVSKSSKKVYTINISSGLATFTASLDVSGDFTVGGLTIGADGVVYIVKSNSNDSEIYSFSTFPDGALSQTVTLTGSKNIESLAGHPNGLLYAASSSKWFNIHPGSKAVSVELNYSSTLKGFDFYYPFEAANCTEEDDELSCEDGEAGLIDGVFMIMGSDGNDSIQVSEDGNYWKVDADLDDGDTVISEKYLKSEVTSIFMCGGGGDDQLQLGAFTGNSLIYGGDGVDQIQGGLGNDTIYGGAGDDDIQGKEGDDVLYGEDGDDNLQGGNGDDMLDGVAEED